MRKRCSWCKDSLAVLTVWEGDHALIYGQRLA